MDLTELRDAAAALVDGTLPSVGTLPSAARAGTYYGRYRIEECLGMGSMGAVYRASDPLLNREVALKSILQGFDELTVGLRFLREAEVLARLNHPNIVRIFDAGVHERTSFIVLEHLTGQSLRQLLDQKKRLPAADALSLLFPVISAIAHAHSRGILHLDLKPSNLFITRDYLRRAYATVLDFGVCQFRDIARELDPTRDEQAGTPAYMSPEAFARAELTQASDQFALATLVYECLAGFSPFTRGSIRDTWMAKQSGQRPNLGRLCSAATPAFCEVLACALDPDPKQRFASVREFGKALLAASPRAVKARFAAVFAVAGD